MTKSILKKTSVRLELGNRKVSNFLAPRRGKVSVALFTITDDATVLTHKNTQT